MFTETDSLEAEPPQCFSDPLSGSCSPESDYAADIMLAAAPPQPQTHALVIGRHTLEPIVALMKSGCESVETHSLDAPAAHLDQASLAWIADIETSDELEAAIHQASTCLTSQGRMVLDATALVDIAAVATVLRCLTKVGFRLRSVFHRESRLIVVAARRPQMALAA